MTKQAGGLVDIGDLDPDSGWEPLTLLAGYTGNLFARRIGIRINVRGLVTPTVNWGVANADNQICDSVPTDLQPGDPFVTISAAQGGLATTVWRTASSGVFINLRPSTGGATTGVYINYDYLAD